jgi:hypothetical protein
MRFLRVLLAFPLLLFGVFCAYGFLASFEPGDFLIFRILYPALGAVSVAGAVWMILGRPRRSEAKIPKRSSSVGWREA